MRGKERRKDIDAEQCILRDDELDLVSGGKTKLTEVVIVHKIDKASPVLL